MLRPLQDRILVQRMARQEKTKGGIFIPETAKEKPIEAKVVAVGPGYHLKSGKIRPLAVEPNQRVLFAKYSGTDVKIEGEEYLLLREEDVLAIVADD